MYVCMYVCMCVISMFTYVYKIMYNKLLLDKCNTLGGEPEQAVYRCVTFFMQRYTECDFQHSSGAFLRIEY